VQVSMCGVWWCLLVQYKGAVFWSRFEE